ncbi:MAG TPA: PilT/PilU family type 4a pilus ATPase [Cellulomonas sp.]
MTTFLPGSPWPSADPTPAPAPVSDSPTASGTEVPGARPATALPDGPVGVPSAYGSVPSGEVAASSAYPVPNPYATPTAQPAPAAQPVPDPYPATRPISAGASSPYPGATAGTTAAPASSSTVYPSAPVAPESIAAHPTAVSTAVAPTEPAARMEVLGSAAPELDAVLHAAIAADASDVHLVAGMAPIARIDGRLRVFEGHGPIGDAELRTLLLSIVTDTQREAFLADHELDFAYQLGTGDAFRTNFYLQTGAMAAAFRLIPERIRSLSELGVPAIVGTFASLPRGLVLVTGPTGSGKSTTLAAVIDQANSTRDDHILTVEDPIEFRHRSRRCLVTQREVGSDTGSFGTALRQALRQDPDIILVGELRDLETIQVALTAAETGHLVFGTLHTQDSGQTVDRIIDAFPTGAQEQVRTQLSATLQGIVSQTLCPKADGVGRAVATEVLVTTPAVRSLIRDNRTHQLYSTLHGGREHGMCTLDQSLAGLVQRDEITFEVGLSKCTNPEEFSRMCGRTAHQRGAVVPGQEW